MADQKPPFESSPTHFAVNPNGQPTRFSTRQFDKYHAIVFEHSKIQVINAPAIEKDRWLICLLRIVPIRLVNRPIPTYKELLQPAIRGFFSHALFDKMAAVGVRPAADFRSFAWGGQRLKKISGLWLHTEWLDCTAFRSVLRQAQTCHHVHRWRTL